MAGIDKLYGDYADFDELRRWVIAYHPKLIFGMYTPFAGADDFTVGVWEQRPIANFAFAHDRLLLWRCPLPFVREYLAKQCGLKTRWYHKLFFTKL